MFLTPRYLSIIKAFNYKNFAFRHVNQYHTLSLAPNRFETVCQVKEGKKLQHHHILKDKQNCQIRSKSTALVLYDSLVELKSSPVPALVYGLSGLIPFVAAPVYFIVYQTYYPVVAFAQMAYGASILSFLGGVRWGFALMEESPLRMSWTNIGISVTPSLVAWVGLLFPDPYSLFTVMIGLAGAGYYDIVSWGYPLWFKGLRFILTFSALLSLWTTFVCKLVLKSTEDEKLTASGDH